MKSILLGAAALVSGLLILWQVIRVLGARLPEAHHATQQALVAADLEAVRARIREIEKHPSWRRDLKRVSITGRSNGAVQYVEESSDGTIAYSMRESPFAPQFRTEITDESLPFGGAWSYTLAPAPGGAVTVTIAEDGVVRDPAFRFLSHHVFGHDRSMRKYLASLVASFP